MSLFFGDHQKTAHIQSIHAAPHTFMIESEGAESF